MLLMVFCAEVTADEDQKLLAIRSEAKLLIKKKKYPEAERLLINFIRLNPRSNRRFLLYYDLGELYLEHRKVFERGFQFLFEASKTKDMELREKVNTLKSQYALSLTEVRLNRVEYFLSQYFAKKVRFPETLSELKKYYPSLKKMSFKDGWGNKLKYYCQDNPAVKGEDKQWMKVFSLGKDHVEGNSDDVYPVKNKAIDKDKALQMVTVFKGKNGEYEAEMRYKVGRKYVQQKVRVGDYLQEYFILGIVDEGALLLRNGKPYVVRNKY